MIQAAKKILCSFILSVELTGVIALSGALLAKMKVVLTLSWDDFLIFTFCLLHQRKALVSNGDRMYLGELKRQYRLLKLIIDGDLTASKWSQ